MNCGIALSGGASKGLVHIYALERLKNYNFKCVALSGASAGAIIGGMYAYGYSTTEIEKILSGKGFQNLVKRKFSFFNWKCLNPFNPEIGFFDTEKLYEYFNTKVFFGEKLENCKIPFGVSVTNMKTCETEYILTGNMAEAITYSMTFPIIFKSRNNIYYDGGVRENCPIKLLHQLNVKIPFEKTIALTVQKIPNTDENYHKNIFTFTERLIMDVMWYGEQVEDITQADYVYNFKVPFGFFDFDKFDEAKEIVKNQLKML